MTLSRNRDEEERMLRQFRQGTRFHSLLEAAEVLRYREEAYQRLNDSEQMREYITPRGQQYWVEYPYDRGDVHTVHYTPTIERRNRYEYQTYNRIQYNHEDLLEDFQKKQSYTILLNEFFAEERRNTDALLSRMINRRKQKEKGENIAKQQEKTQRPKLPEL